MNAWSGRDNEASRRRRFAREEILDSKPKKKLFVANFSFPSFNEHNLLLQVVCINIHDLSIYFWDVTNKGLERSKKNIDSFVKNVFE